MTPNPGTVIAFDEATLDYLAEALAERMAQRLTGPTETQQDGWIDSKEAAAYLGISRDALAKLTAAETIPFSQDGPGAKTYFKRLALGIRPSFRSGLRSLNRATCFQTRR